MGIYSNGFISGVICRTPSQNNKDVFNIQYKDPMIWEEILEIKRLYESLDPAHEYTFFCYTTCFHTKKNIEPYTSIYPISKRALWLMFKTGKPYSNEILF